MTKKVMTRVLEIAAKLILIIISLTSILVWLILIPEVKQAISNKLPAMPEVSSRTTAPYFFNELPYFAEIFVTFLIIALVSLQIIIFCVWKLLTRLRRGTFFTTPAIKYVTISTATFCLSAGLAAALAIFIVLNVNHLVIAVIAVIATAIVITCAAAATIAIVMRSLFLQATSINTDAHVLKAELAEVI